MTELVKPKFKMSFLEMLRFSRACDEAAPYCTPALNAVPDTSPVYYEFYGEASGNWYPCTAALAVEARSKNIKVREFTASNSVEIDRIKTAVPDEWRNALRECADDLASELDMRYSERNDRYCIAGFTNLRQQYEEEMQPVYRARELLGDKP